MKVNDNVNENDYYKDAIIFETLAGSQVIYALCVHEGARINQMNQNVNLCTVNHKIPLPKN
ncbi:hypothetical protein DMI62_05570 [Escherichia coli]|nr:hypothetical protein [Escherichia coli]